MLYKINNLSKVYQINSKETFYALKDISLDLPSIGLVSLVGPSGCGKSTLLNILGKIDQPTSGEIYFKGKKISRIKDDKYRRENVGFIFQSYNLIEDESVLDNITLPLRINGIEIEENKIKEFLKKVNLDTSFLYKKVSDLSGGEKQRVAILRAIINKPKVILADEPTGALDEENSLSVLKILNKLSKECLVILVSHNLDLVKSYSDEIIHIKDGTINKIETINVLNEIKTVMEKTKIKNGFISKLTIKSLLKKKEKHLLSLIAMTFGMISTFLIMGFSFNYKNVILQDSYNQIDYGVMTLQNEEIIDVSSNGFSMIKKSRLDTEAISKIQSENEKAIIDINYSYLFPINSTFKYLGQKLDSTSFTPIYSFSEIKNKVLIDGEIPLKEDINLVVVNEELANRFYERFKKSIIGCNIDIFISKEVPILSENNERNFEYFIFNETLMVAGVVEDFSFLVTPKIYHSYSAYKYYLQNTILDGLFNKNNNVLTWYEAIVNSSDNSDLSSYSHYVFANKSTIDLLLNKYKEGIVLTSLAKTRERAFLDLVNIASLGLYFFLAIIVLGVVLIIGIISFSSYSEDIKKIAIYYCFGASKNQVSDIYSNHNLLINILSISISLVSLPLITFILNKFLFNFIGIKEIIPNLITVSNPKLLFLMFSAILLSLGITFLSSSLPIYFASGLKISEELKDD